MTRHPAPWASLAERCHRVAQQVDDILLTLPLARSPRADEVTRFLRSDDVKTAEVPLPDGSSLPLAYVESLIDKKRLWHEVIEPLARGDVPPERLPRSEGLASLGDVLHRLLEGFAVLLPPDGRPRGVELKGLNQRQVEEPTTEKQIVGPKESLVEKLDTSVGLVRNRLRDVRLRVEVFVVGRRARTRVALLYVEGVTSDDLVERTREGLAHIALDHVRTAMDIGESLFQHSLTTFPLVEQTERPDRVAAALAVGRLALVVEGMPFALLVPVSFFEFNKDGESAVPGALVTAFVRNLRLLGMFVALAVPGLYVALLSASVAVLPPSLALTLTATRFGVPYPVLTETLFMLLISDVLAEATAQSAAAIGNTLAIVGALIVGQMIVMARLASTLQMIVIASTVIGSFMTLKYSFSYSLRMWKYPVVLLSGVGGLMGWMTGMLVLLVHLASLKSAGVPYLKPLAPLSPYDVTHYGPVQPNRGQLRLRPAMWNPRQAERARRGGRR
jgi:spore germination protein KA